MPETILYSLQNKDLIKEAERIEKYAQENIKAWIILGQHDRYAEEINKAFLLRKAAQAKGAWLKKEILSNAGYIVKNKKNLFQENPTMKPASPAQLAARKRFAEMARSGAFKKATKRKANPATIQYIVFSELSPQKYKQMLVTENKQRAISVANVNQMDGYHSVVEDQVGHLIYDAKTKQGYLQSNPSKRKTNPMPQVPQIILQQLGGSKFIAMTGAKEFIGGSEFLGFKIPKNRSSANRVTIKYFPARDLYEVDFIKSSRNGLDTKIIKTYDNVYADQLRQIFTSFTGMETSLGTLGRKTNPAKKTVSQKISQLVHEGYPQRQAVAVALSEQRAGKVKRNPAKVKYRNLATNLKGDQRVGYSVHMADRPSYQAIAWFSKKADAMEVAQEAADRTGKQLAVTRVQNYFGAI